VTFELGGFSGPFLNLEEALVNEGVIQRDAGDPIWLGLMAANARLQQFEMAVPQSEAYRESVLMSIDLLGAQSQRTPQAAALFVENVLIASSMRARYEEPALSPADLERYLEVSRWFHNSLWHD
jgi:hypothetical protein